MPASHEKLSPVLQLHACFVKQYSYISNLSTLSVTDKIKPAHSSPAALPPQREGSPLLSKFSPLREDLSQFASFLGDQAERLGDKAQKVASKAEPLLR